MYTWELPLFVDFKQLDRPSLIICLIKSSLFGKLDSITTSTRARPQVFVQLEPALLPHWQPYPQSPHFFRRLCPPTAAAVAASFYSSFRSSMFSSSSPSPLEKQQNSEWIWRCPAVGSLRHICKFDFLKFTFLTKPSTQWPHLHKHYICM